MRYLMALCLSIVTTYAYAQQLAFPTAEGWGRFASGGRGNGTTGYVCHVNSLSGSSAGSAIAGTPHYQGSFTYCLQSRSGPRTIIFDIAGIIDGNENIIHTSLGGDVTIAGQTAPGDGILFKKAWLRISKPNVIVRHLVSRAGPISDPDGAYSFKSMEAAFGANNSIFDHCSFSWATDDVFGVWQSNDVTVQRTIFSDGLPDANYGKGGIEGSGATRVSYLHNLWANHVARLPYLQSGDIQYVNNVIYNGNQNTEVAPITSAVRVEFINNHYKRGPNSVGTYGTSIRNLGPCWAGCGWLNSTYAANTSIYLSGNFHTTLRPNNTFAENSLVQQGGGGWPTASSPYTPAFPSIPTLLSSSETYTDVINNVGAYVPIRNDEDAQVLNEVTSGTGASNRTLAELGGYPTITAASRDTNTYDTDWDGIPNSWETQCGSLLGGLSPSNVNDGNDIVSGVSSTVNGYSKLEVYLNSVAGDYGTNGVSTCAGLSGEDTDPPTTPVLSDPSVASSDQIDLSWTAATDASGIGNYIVTYCIDVDETADCTPNIDLSMGDTDLTYNHTGLQADTIYGYQVRALDVPGNEGSKSTPIEYATTDSPPGADITTGLVSHWSLNSVLTDAGSANVTLSAVGSPGYVSGRISDAIDLSGSGQYLTRADSVAHDFGTSTDFSFALWFQPDATGKQYLLSKGQSEGGSSDGIWFIEYGSISGNFLAGISSDTWNNYCAVKAPLNVSDGAWHHVGVNILRNASCTISDIEIYIDGVLATNRSVQFSGTNTNANISNDDPLWVGAENVSGSPTSLFNGRIDDVRVYNRTLAAEDMQALVDLGDTDTEAPTDPSNLVATPSLEDGSPVVSLSWGGSTDNVGPITYRIQRCIGNSCNDFSDLNTSTANSYLDDLLQEHQYFRYRVRAEDAVPNVSNYTSPVQVLTLYSVIPPLSPSALTTSYSGSVTFTSVPTNIATAANTTVSGSSGPTNLATTASSTVNFPSLPTGVTTP